MSAPRLITVRDRDGRTLVSRPFASYDDVIAALDDYPGHLISTKGLSHDQNAVVLRHFGRRCHCGRCAG